MCYWSPVVFYSGESGTVNYQGFITEHKVQVREVLGTDRPSGSEIMTALHGRNVIDKDYAATNRLLFTPESMIKTIYKIPKSNNLFYK